MPDPTSPIAPKPGTPASVRKQELDNARFIDVRNLSYLFYKRADGTALMQYAETLDNRDLVKQTVLQHEIALGLVVPDGSEAAVAAPTTTPAQPVQNGVPMNPTFAPPPAATPAQAAAAPMGAPVPGYAPPPQAAPQQVPVQNYPPQQAPAAPPAAPPQDAAPAAPAGGRGRRRGAAVAPPPPGPQGVPPGAVQVAAPPPAPGAPMAPQGAPVPAPGFQQVQVPGAPVGAPAPQFTSAPAPQQLVHHAPAQAAPQPTQTAPSIDLTPIISRLDDLGKGLTVTAGNSDEALKAVAALRSEVAELKLIGLEALAALHHIYLSTGTLGQAAAGKAANLPDFRNYLHQYIGNPK